MKKLLFILLLIPFISFSQTYQTIYPTSGSGEISNGGSVIINLYSPAYIVGGVQMWYKTDEGAGVDYALNGSGVSTIYNRGTLSINGTQGTAINQPVLVPNTFNGLAVYQWANGSSLYWNLSTTFTISPTGSVCCVGSCGTGGNSLFLFTNTSTAMYYLALEPNCACPGQAEVAQWLSGTYNTGTISGWGTTYTFAAYVSKANNSTGGTFYSGQSNSQTQPGYGSCTASNNIGNYHSSSYSSGAMPEFMAFNKALSAVEISYIRYYLCQKYALWTCQWFEKNNKSTNPYPVYYAYNHIVGGRDLYYLDVDGTLEPIHLHVNNARLYELYGYVNEDNWINITNTPKEYEKKYPDIPYRNLFADNK